MKTKTLLACGIIGGPVFVLAFLVEGATRANYDPLRHPVSSLALGDSGWTQTTNFIVTGLLTLALAPSTARRGPIPSAVMLAISVVLGPRLRGAKQCALSPLGDQA